MENQEEDKIANGIEWLLKCEFYPYLESLLDAGMKRELTPREQENFETMLEKIKKKNYNAYKIVRDQYNMVLSTRGYFFEV